MGGDDLQHYMACPMLGRFALHRRLQAPRWAGTGHMQIVLMLLPLSEHDTCVSAVWLYIAHFLYRGARHDVRVWDAAFFESSARAAVRSTLARVPTIRDFLVREAA